MTLSSSTQYFGPKAADRLILTHEITLVYGDFHIDDKGVITGAVTPAWKHLINDQSHNRYVLNAPWMSNWSQWRHHVYPLLDPVSV